MKNLKKIAALVIVLAMALSSVAFASFSDVSVDASYNEAVTVMSALGLLKGYEDGTFGPDKTITRAEFAAVVVRALGMEDAAAGAVTNTKFTDVTSSHWAAGYVQIANQQGIIAGYGDGKFGPDDEVTYEQAVKMIVCALGYSPKFATVADAYPTAYLAQANTSGITVGAVGKIGDKASRATVARLVYNALDVPLMEQLSFGKDVEYGIPENYTTLLANNLKVAKVEGSVNSISFNKDDGNKLNFSISAIDDVYETLSGFSTSTYTIDYAESVVPMKGYTCIAYIDCNEDDEVIAALAPKAGKNKTLTINATQSKDASVDFVGNKLEYYKTSVDVDSKTTTVKLDENVLIYSNLDTTEYDGNFGSNYKDGNFQEITLIDNNNDNDYDFIFVKEYYSFVVSDINTGAYKLMSDDYYFGAENSVKLDPEDDAVKFDIKDKDGKAVKFEDIKVNDVVNVFESNDGTSTYYEVIVSNETIKGTISEESEDKYKISDKEYKASPDSDLSLQAGDSGVFYVDMYGVILKYELDGTNRKFGMVYAVYVDTSGVDADAKLIMYTAEGKYETYSFNTNVTINDKSGVKSKELVTGTGSAATLTGKIATGQYLAMYVTNSNNAITEIYYNDGTVDGIAKKDSNYGTKLDGEDLFRASSSRLGSYYVEESSKIITNKEAVHDQSKDIYGIASSALFVDDGTTKYSYELIYNKDKEVVLAVVFNSKAQVDKASDVMFVTSVGSTNDSEGNTAKSVTGVVNGETVNFKITGDTNIYKYDNSVLEDSNGYLASSDDYNKFNVVTKGSLIQFAGKDEVSAVRVIATAAEIKNVDEDTLNSETDEEDDEIGFLYSGQLNEFTRATAIFGDGTKNADGTYKFDKEVSLSAATPSMFINEITGRLVTTDSVSIRSAESFKYEDTDNANDDYVIIYKYDGDALAVIVVDYNNDTKL